nr:Calcium-binding protein 39 [Polyrhizophydium stewartii]
MATKAESVGVKDLVRYDNFKTRFVPKEFVESILSALVAPRAGAAAAAGQTKDFDPKPLIRAFDMVSDELFRLKKRVQSKIDDQEDQAAASESSRRRKMKDFSDAFDAAIIARRLNTIAKEVDIAGTEAVSYSCLARLYEEIEAAIYNEWDAIVVVFPNAASVIQVFVQRIFAQSIQNYLEVLVERAKSESPRAYLQTLALSHAATGKLVANIHRFDEKVISAALGAPALTSLLNRCFEDLFVPYIENGRYINLELDELDDLSAADTKVEPDLGHLQIAKTTTRVLQIFQLQFQTQLMILFKNELFSSLEQKVNALLQGKIAVASAWLEVLLSRQKKTDFKPRDDIVAVNTLATPVCNQIVEYVRRIKDEAEESLDGENLEAYLTEIGVSLHSLLLDHFRRFPVSYAGGLVLTKDLAKYHEVIMTFKISLLEERFDMLKELGTVFIVKPENLKTVLNEGYLGRIELHLLYPYLSLRADWSKLLKIEHELFDASEMSSPPKAKTPAELVRGLKEAVGRLESSTDARKPSLGPGRNLGPAQQANEEISKNLVAMKTVLYGDGENDPVPELVTQLSSEAINSDLLVVLVNNIQFFEFEAKKDVAQIFNNLLKRQLGSRFPTADYIGGKPDILFVLVGGQTADGLLYPCSYDNQDVSLNCGMILRECVRHEPLAKAVLESQQFWRFFEFVELSTFDVASDAFATFKDLLTRHKLLVARFLEARYDEFFARYTNLLNSSNYVTKRQSLKLLGELLLDRTNFAIMSKYIANPENLKLMMNLLKEKSRNIQFEAFHVFKVFVANPNKAKPILDILQKNKDKLVTYLSNFHNERADDEQFNDEKAFLIKQIQDL